MLINIHNWMNSLFVAANVIVVKLFSRFVFKTRHNVWCANQVDWWITYSKTENITLAHDHVCVWTFYKLNFIWYYSFSHSLNATIPWRCLTNLLNFFICSDKFLFRFCTSQLKFEKNQKTFYNLSIWLYHTQFSFPNWSRWKISCAKLNVLVETAPD